MQIYFYTISSVLFLFAWLIIFFFNPKHRKSIFWTSWNFAPAGPVSEYWHYGDYWHPPYIIDIIIGKWHFGIEDYLFAFSVAGISVFIFESIAVKNNLENIPPVNKRTYIKMKTWGVIGLILVIITSSTGLHSITSIIITLLITSVLIHYRRRKIFIIALSSSLIFIIFYWFYFYAILLTVFPSIVATYWNINNLMGISFTGIPLEEFLWCFSAGLFTGPVYRICSTKKEFSKLLPV